MNKLKKLEIICFYFVIGYIKDAPCTTNCVNCDVRIAQGEMAVIAPKFREQVKPSIFNLNYIFLLTNFILNFNIDDLASKMFPMQ